MRLVKRTVLDLRLHDVRLDPGAVCGGGGGGGLSREQDRRRHLNVTHRVQFTLAITVSVTRNLDLPNKMSGTTKLIVTMFRC